MNFSARSNSQAKQYAIIGGVLLFLVGLFISYPSLSNSAADNYINGTAQKNSPKLQSWESVYQGLAPGEALGGASSDTASSSLFVATGDEGLMFQYEEKASTAPATTAKTVSAGGKGSGSGTSAARGASVSNYSAGGLGAAISARLQSMSFSGLGGGGGSGSGASGSGYASGIKGGANGVSVTSALGGGLTQKSGGLDDAKDSRSMAALRNTALQSYAAAASGDANSMAAGAGAAFGDSSPRMRVAGGGVEVVQSGLPSVGSASDSKHSASSALKGNELSITHPTVPEGAESSADEHSTEEDKKAQLIKMILTFGLTMVLGMLFGAQGAAMGPMLLSYLSSSKIL